MTGQAGSTSEITVLVVDDDDLFRSGLSSLLAAERDIEVVAQASGGRAGVRLAHNLRPDVVLMGARMPDLLVAEATRAVLSDRPSTRVLALTAPSSGDEDVEEAVGAGACGCLVKETPVAEVAAAIRAAAHGVAWLSPRAAEIVLGQMRNADPGKESDLEAVEELSGREIDVLQLIARGLDTDAIAAELQISPRAAQDHVASILSRLNRRGPGPEGSSGVREPRGPWPQTGGGSAQVLPPTG